ncbi:autotransporter outer membrane beta-barrel domain-containing protein [Fusobacterium varium]|uniref:autotransporter outer membrane beta-barrel domain-containing protein n=1 Tax=Fusobacterium varium TaxID=856 RepID=UPI000219C11E|nr:autotransporter outer membrane beta-barrel domain-containing protein [Fusobacterium varium]EGR54274.1 autotransporter beta-domain protein [Fusobacterium varium ATCC 27725]
MIEKIMKAVKRGNKRRGRNITIGAVVGFLLSCTAVMGEDNYLWIKGDSGAIEFNTTATTDDDGKWEKENPYSDNKWDKDTKTYTNNMILLSNGEGGNYGRNLSYGLRLSGELTDVNFVNNGSIIGIMRDTSSSSSGYGIYNSAKMSNIENTGVISGSGIYNGNAASYGYGIYNNSSAEIKDITNTGTISGFADDVNDSGSTASGHGIYNDSGAEIQNIKNTGLISGYGTGRRGSNGYGIYNNPRAEIKDITNIGAIINIGVISGYGDDTTSSIGSGNGYGIYNNGIYNNELAKIGNITNTGVISGYGSGTGSASSSGIYSVNNDFSTTSDGEIENITNTGIISGSGVGIYNAKSGSKYKMEIGDITNTGVIYGKDNAIKNNSGTIGTVDNYGILATQGDSVIKGTIGTEKNYGLYIGKDGKITVGTEKLSDDSIKVVVGYTEDGKEIVKDMTIKNATLNGDSGSATSTVSFVLEGESGEYDNSILNGKDETLKVSGTGNQITDSIINAYETAVVMDSKDSALILNNTIANGGAAEDGEVATIEIKGENNTLTLKGESIVNTGGKDNVAITVEGENNVLVLEGNAKVNGEMKATGENNTLNLYGKVNSNLNKSNNISEAASMNILHNITGFTNMNIDNNVTFFEDVKVTGTEKVTIAETGTLNLRLKNTEETVEVGEEFIPKATHAFSGNKNEMVIQGEGTAGTLRFITNGIGKKIYVDMENIELRNLYFKTSSIIDGYEVNDKVSVILGAYGNLNEIYRPENMGKSHRYEALNNIYKGIYSSTDDNLNALRVLISSNGKLGNNYDENMSDEEQLKNLLSYLGSIYTETPYSFSSELSRKSAGMFRDIITENQFKPNLNQWLIMGGLTHTDGGTKDSYYGQNYHGFDTGTADVDVDMKLTGAYALGKYGYSENVSLGVTVGGNRSEAKLPMSKVKGNSGYIGAFAENYRGNLTLKAGAGIQYSEYDANRATLGGHSYSEKYSDMTYDIYLNGRYSHNIGENLFLEPYGTLSYTYIKQDSADEGSKVLAIETDSKTFDYTAAKVGVDLKKVIPHEKGKSTLSAGVSYTRLLTGADEENITGRFKGENATDFDILVAHKNEQSIGLNAKYALELESGILFDVKGSYNVERDSHNGTGKNRAKGEWIVGAGIGYKF